MAYGRLLNTKEAGIEDRVLALVHEFGKVAPIMIEKVLSSGAVDVEGWDSEYNSMILPKAIFIAMLRDTINGYSAKGTSFEKTIKKESKNIELFL